MTSDEKAAEPLEVLIRRVIREELNKYDRDKGITPRMSSSGVPGGLPYPWGNKP